jgi:hypothetical protein
MIYSDAANTLADMQEEDSWYNDTTGSFDIRQYLKVTMDDHDHNEVDVFNSMIYDDEEDHSEDEDDAPSQATFTLPEVQAL